MTRRYLPGESPLDQARRKLEKKLRRNAPKAAPLTEPQQFVRNLPVMHNPRGGAPHTGGLGAITGQLIIDEVGSMDRPRVVETGSGASTLLFLMLGASEVVAINPDHEVAVRIGEEAAARGLDTTGLTCVEERSETALARLALDGHRCDVAFIDGNHGWPSVFVDFCFLNMMLVNGGLLLIDDIQIYSCDQLLLLLDEQHQFERVPARGKLAAFRKRSDAPFLPDWALQPFLVEQTHPRFRPRMPRPKP